MSNPGSYISDLEWAANETANWCNSTRQYLLDALAPDGRGFGMVAQTPRERLETYLTTLKNNPQAITQWIIEQAAKVAEVVGTMGPQVVASVHPLDTAQKMWIVYSYQMEQAFKRELEKVQGVAA